MSIHRNSTLDYEFNYEIIEVEDFDTYGVYKADGSSNDQSNNSDVDFLSIDKNSEATFHDDVVNNNDVTVNNKNNNNNSNNNDNNNNNNNDGTVLTNGSAFHSNDVFPSAKEEAEGKTNVQWYNFRSWE